MSNDYGSKVGRQIELTHAWKARCFLAEDERDTLLGKLIAAESRLREVERVLGVLGKDEAALEALVARATTPEGTRP
jgi:hypothetical protein